MEEIRIRFHSSSLINEGVSHLDVYFPIPNMHVNFFLSLSHLKCALETVM